MKTNPSRIASRLILTIGLVAVAFVRLVAAEAMPMKSELLPAYVKIAEALAADDLSTAKTAAGALADHAGMAEQKQIAEQAGSVAKATDLPAARERFKTLSLSIEPLAAGEDGYTVMTCTMANADWVQASTEVKNPYLGKSMQSCGEPKKIDAAPEHDCGSHGHNGSGAHKGCGA
jgi:hypothetical protein